MSDSIEDFGLLDRLSTSMQDPYIDRKLQQVRDMTDMVNDAEYTAEERAKMLSKLDSDWVYFQKKLIISGVIWCISSDTVTLERKVVTELEAISDGFMFDPDRVELDGSYVEGDFKPAFAFKINQLDKPGVKTYGAMHFTDIHFIEYPFPSVELRSQRFRYHNLEDADAIDCAVFSAKNTTEMIQNLDGTVVFERLIDDPHDKEEVGDLESYLNEMMDLDTILPYWVTVEGQIATISDTTKAKVSFVSAPARMLAIVRKIRILPEDMSSRSAHGLQRFVPFLEVHFYDQNKTAEPLHTIVPFSSVIEAESVREEI